MCNTAFVREKRILMLVMVACGAELDARLQQSVRRGRAGDVGWSLYILINEVQLMRSVTFAHADCAMHAPAAAVK